MNNKSNFSFAGSLLGLVCIGMGVYLLVTRGDSSWPLFGEFALSGNVLGYIAIGFGVLNIVMDIIENIHRNKK